MVVLGEAVDDESLAAVPVDAVAALTAAEPDAIDVAELVGLIDVVLEVVDGLVSLDLA